MYIYFNTALTSVPKPDDQDRLRWSPDDEDSVKRITAPMKALYDDIMSKY